jgi:quercetin dioxygenase-like cupin family protein
LAENELHWGDRVMRRLQSTILIGLLPFFLALEALGQSSTETRVFSELQRGRVIDTDDLEVVMGLIERSGKSVSAKHYHPGGEFGFVLEGAITVSTGHEAHTTLKEGDSFYQPPGEWHLISTGSEGTKTIVFRILRKGQPIIVTVE